MKNNFLKARIILPAVFLAGFFVFGVLGKGAKAAETISEDTVWNKGEVKIIEGVEGLMVMPGATLTINPGVIIKMGANASISIAGSLIAKGDSSDPIIFTSIKDDSAGGDTNGDGAASLPSRGDWSGIIFGGDELCSLDFDYVQIKYANIAIFANEMDNFSIAHSVITENSRAGIVLNSINSGSINYSNIYSNYNPVSGCQTQNGIYYCLDIAFRYYGDEPIDATNNY